MFDYTKDDLARIPCPVYGFYGENDARINKSIPDTVKAMKAAGKMYEPITYDGAGHGFMRAGEDPSLKMDDANRKARNAGWERWKGLLKKI
jgi:carboxymethylenebutenolidase